MLLNKEEEFIKENIGLVHLCCKRFVGKGYDYDDLFQAGSLGLLRASREFNPDLGFRFSTYAVPVILGEIKRLFRDNGSVKVSRSLKELSLKVSKTVEVFEKENGTSPTVSQIAKLLSVPEEEINEALDVSKPVMSLTFYSNDGIKEEDIPVIDEQEQISNHIMIGQAMQNLSTQDKKLIHCRYFEGLTQSETAKLLNMTQVQVSRREKKVIEEMRKNLTVHNR